MPHAYKILKNIVQILVKIIDLYKKQLKESIPERKTDIFEHEAKGGKIQIIVKTLLKIKLMVVTMLAHNIHCKKSICLFAQQRKKEYPAPT